MSNKVGRPKVPKSKAKAVLIGARFAPDEARQVSEAAKRANLDKSKWVRSTLLAASK